MEKPKKRSLLRAKCGMFYYKTKRKLLWCRMRRQFAAQRPAELLPEVQFSHHTPLLRKLKDVDMELQYNKVVNLRLAAEKIDRVILYPGQDLQLLVSCGQNLGEKRI